MMMKNIISAYLLVLGINLITAYTTGTMLIGGETESVTFAVETTLSGEIDQTSSTDIPFVINPTYIITNLNFSDTTMETTLSTDGTGELISTTIYSDPRTDQTSLFIRTISTAISSTTTTTTTTTAFLTTTISSNCNVSTHIQLLNNTCATKIDVQTYTVNILRNRTANTTALASSLSLYISSTTNANISWNPYYILSTDEIDDYVSSFNNVTLTINSDTSFIMIQQPNQRPNITILGASYTHDIGGTIIDSLNANNIYNSNLTTAAIIHNQSLVDVTSINMLIIDKPTTYENLDHSSNKILASSVIVVALQRNSSVFIPMNISLYFQVLNEYRPNIDAIYSCSFYDASNQRWNESGCTQPQLNTQFNRYECSCNHLSTFALVWSLNITPCDTMTQVQWSNGTCLSKADAQIATVNILRSNSTNSTVIADALSLYISSITNSNTSLNSTYTLTLGEIDMYLTSMENVNLTRNNNDSYLMVQQPSQGDSDIVLGAAFTRGIGGEIVRSTNKDNVINANLSTAAVISNESLTDVISLRMLIIRKPSAYRYIDNSTNKTLVSSIVLATVKKINSSSTSMNISLYFQVLKEWKSNTTDVTYFCSFYDTNNRRWNESGCTQPQFNTQFDRYECSCNHLTSFALLFLPNVLHTRYLDAQDIASLVFQSISILCFLFIIIHAIIILLGDPLKSFRAYNLLPLISYASTTILFIFYIALGMTVYTKTSSLDQTQCFLSSSVLMFFVYFFLIFMFCTKTSVGYFNYLRFVRLFPQPPLRQLSTMLVISFSISIAWVAFAAGFNSHSSLKITQLIPYKLCWFSLDVIYYFLTIPVCLFLLINIILFVLVAVRIINHARNATSPHQSYERMKRSVLVLLSSCLTQGIGWLFGVFLTFVNPTAGKVLGWIFIVFNGLEGLWVIILYIIIRSQHMDEQKHARAARKLKGPKKSIHHKYYKSSTDDHESKSNIITKETGINSRSSQTKSSRLSDG